MLSISSLQNAVNSVHVYKEKIIFVFVAKEFVY